MKNFATKGSAEGLHCPGTRRKQRPSCNTYKEGPYWAGMCRLCSQLCRRTPAPATSPLPLCAFVRATEWRFYTELIAQQRLCVCNKKAPPIPDYLRLVSWHHRYTQTHAFIPVLLASTEIQPHSLFLKDAKVMNPPSVGWYELRWWVGQGWRSLLRAPHPGSVHLAPNCFWLMKGLFYVTYGIFGSQAGDCISWCFWVRMSQGHSEQG